MALHIKTIVVSKNDFVDINNDILLRYKKIENNIIDFSYYYQWALAGCILGIFSGSGDVKSSALFFKCLEQNKVPSVSLKMQDDNVRICICIKEKSNNEKRLNIKNIRK